MINEPMTDGCVLDFTIVTRTITEPERCTDLRRLMSAGKLNILESMRT